MNRPHFDMVASGLRMKMIRQEKHISVKDVMEYMGFESTQAVYKWESGKCFPQADNLVALAMLYEVSPSELLVKEDEMSSFYFDILYKAKARISCVLVSNKDKSICSISSALCILYSVVFLCIKSSSEVSFTEPL